MQRMAILFTALMSTTGCMSFTSTMLNRLDDDQYVGNSNGDMRPSGEARPFKGIPITLKVPTHLDIYIDEVYFLKLKTDTAIDIFEGKSRLLDVRTEVIKSDKVFTVDFKRPGAGSLDLDMQFDEAEQYFTKIASKLDDQTITQSAALLSTVLGKFAGVSASTGVMRFSEDVAKRLLAEKIIRDTRVVAYQRFDLNSPTFEADVECFVNTHLNDCNHCGGRPTYDN